MKSEDYQKALKNLTVGALVVKFLALLFVRLAVIAITYFIFKAVFHYTLNAFEVYAIFLLQGIGSKVE
jgi:hypothetical protein